MTKRRRRKAEATSFGALAPSDCLFCLSSCSVHSEAQASVMALQAEQGNLDPFGAGATPAATGGRRPRTRAAGGAGGDTGAASGGSKKKKKDKKDKKDDKEKEQQDPAVAALPLVVVTPEVAYILVVALGVPDADEPSALNEEMLTAQIQKMGFKKEHASRALAKNEMNLEEALKWLENGSFA